MNKKSVPRVIDLSHFIEDHMPVFPGTPAARIKTLADLQEQGFREKAIALTSHTGTHLDVPAHIVKQGATLDDFPLTALMGRACLVEADVQTDLRISSVSLSGLPEKRNCDFILLKTGWAQKWGSDAYFTVSPFLDEAFARRLTTLGLKGIGIDFPSVDAIDSRDLPVHKILLGARLVIMENLCCLEKLSVPVFTLIAFPLKIRQGDGAPARVAALLDPEEAR